MNRRLTPLLLAALLALPATAQRVSRDYLDTPMTQVLSDLAHAATQQRIVFIHDDLEDFTITQRFDSLTIAEAIGQCIGFYPIRLTAEGDTLLLVECTQRRPYRLIGRLVDEHGAPVSYANITLLSTTDSAHVINKGVSNQNGRFVIPSDSQEVVARFSHVAYEPILQPYKAADIGIVRMKAANERLDNVSVMTEPRSYAEKHYYELAEQIEKKMWSMDLPQLDIDTIPAKYRDAPAVILADYDYLEYKSEKRLQTSTLFNVKEKTEEWIRTIHLHRKRYYVNQPEAATKLSDIVYSRKRDATDIMLQQLTVMGIRITKPDGSQLTIDAKPYLKPRHHRLHSDDEGYDTIHIEGLKAHDILDLFVYHSVRGPMTPYRFEFPRDYPALSYDAVAIGNKHVSFQFREHDRLAERSINLDRKRPKLSYWMRDFDGRSLANQPYTSLYVRPLGKAYVGPKSASRNSIIGNPSRSSILDDSRYAAELNRLRQASQPTMASFGSHAKRTTAYIQHIAQATMSQRQKADSVYCHLLAEADATHYPTTLARNVHLSTTFFDAFANALARADIAYDFALTTPADAEPIDHLMDVGDIIWFVRLSDGTCYFPKSGTPPGTVPTGLKGRKAVLANWRDFFEL